MNKSNKGNKQPQSLVLTLLPILLVIGLIPLIVRLKFIETASNETVWQQEATTLLPDLFSYYKGRLLIGIAIASLIVLIYNLYKNKWSLKDHPFFILLAIYTVLVILSAVFSDYTNVALIGFTERYEGLFVLVSYIIIFIYTATIIQESRQIKLIVNIWMVTSIILFLIGLSQYLNMDIIVSDFARLFIFPQEFRSINTVADSDTSRNVYQTLYHYNYVSFYASIGFPFFLVLAITEKKLKPKVLYSIIAVTFIISQVISLSRNGYVGFFVGLLFVGYFLRTKLFKHWKILVPLTSIVLVGLTLFVMNSDSLTARRIRTGFDSLTLVENHSLNSIETSDHTLYIDHDRLVLNISLDDKDTKTSFKFTDSDNNTLISSYDEINDSYTLETIDSSVFSYKVNVYNEDPTLSLMIIHSDWHFIYTNNEFRYINPDLTFSTIEAAPSIGFEGRETFASERGYIWSRSFPLVLDNLILGTGPDTYALVFPQSDYVGKYNAYRVQYMNVDKPHNLYLNYAVNTGLLSLIILLIFWAYYLYNSFKLYYKTDLNNYYSRIGIASTISILSYFASALFNDTSLNVTPTFWLVLGLGYAVNHQVKKTFIPRKN